MSTVAPYSAADTAIAAHWLDYVAAAFASGPSTLAEAEATARNAVELLERRGLITGGAAALILETFDLIPLDLA
jgi:hypothetical protein